MKSRITYLVLSLLFPLAGWAQINTERVMAIGRNALYFEDYVLSIQYFNQVIGAKPYLADPYFFRGLAKINLDDYPGAESDCSEAIERNPFVVNAYQVRGLARIHQDPHIGMPETESFRCCFCKMETLLSICFHLISRMRSSVQEGRRSYRRKGKENL